MLPTIAPQDDKRPLPLIVAERWAFALTHVDQSGNPNDFLYSVQDWIVGLSGSTKAAAQETWRKLKSNSQFEIESSELPYKATNGKTYQMDFTDARGLYAIAANMRAMDKRPQLQAIKDYLAAAGVFADLARREPEQTAEKLLARAKGIQARNLMTAAAHDTHITQKPNYGALTNAEYEILFGGAKDELVKALGLTKTQAAHFRDQLGELALKALEFAESASATKMRAVGRKLTADEQLMVVQTCARMVAPSFKSLTAYLQVTTVTNLPKGDQ